MGLAVVSLMLVVGAHAQLGGILLPGSPTLYIPSLRFSSDAKESSGGALLPNAPVGGLSLTGLSGGALLPTAPIGASLGRTSSGGFRNTGLTSNSTDPCQLFPCGPNTRCSTTSNGIAQCHCLEDFSFFLVPWGNTIFGCIPQCTRDFDCPDNYRCQATKCVRVCQPNSCGQNAECRPRGERPVCTCPIGYEGDPLTNCIGGECNEANDCPGHMTCQKLRCINPCNIQNICGIDAECQTRNHQPICSCGERMVGDPCIACTRDPVSLCLPSPCGRNTNCEVRNELKAPLNIILELGLAGRGHKHPSGPPTDRAVCSCIDNYLGDPLTGCRPECISDSECPARMACDNNRCVNPCINACGEGALCEVVQGRARCSCPEFYLGNPQSRCFPECVAHDDCPYYQACQKLSCINPCNIENICGRNAECQTKGHKPLCSCGLGMVGDPFIACTPFEPENFCLDNPCGFGADCTPGYDRDDNRTVCTCPRGFIGNPMVSCRRGECERHTDCSDYQACYAYTCQNPCYYDLGSVCGDNAECTVKKNQPVCSCPPGYDGNPLQSCYPGSPRIIAGYAWY